MYKPKRRYPMGSVSHGTMRSEDLIPKFLQELEWQLKNGPPLTRKTRQHHQRILREAGQLVEDESYWQSEDPDVDLDGLFDALNDYAGPYFYFGSHPGDASDYGYWLSESWDEDFTTASDKVGLDTGLGLKVNDLSEVPPDYRGLFVVVNDHGNVTLYCKTSRKLHVIWEMV